LEVMLRDAPNGDSPMPLRMMDLSLVSGQCRDIRRHMHK
jgi:hypothetical protein